MPPTAFRAPRDLRVLTGRGERGPVVSGAVLVGSLCLLTLAVLTSAPLKLAVPLVLAVVVTAAGYRSLLRWPTLLTGLLLVVLFIPIRRYTLPGSLPFQVEPYRLLTAFVAAGWLASLLVDMRVRLRRTFFDAPLMAIAMSMLISDAVNSGRIHSLDVQTEVVKKLTFFASFFAIAYIIPSVIRRPAHVDLVVKALVGGGTVLAICALWEGWTHYNVFNHLGQFIPVLKLDQLPYSLISNQNNRGGRLRVYGPAQSPIALGALFVILLPLGIYLIKRTAQRRWLAATLLIVFGAIASVSRTPIVMLIAMTIVYWRFRRNDVRRLWPLALPLLLAVHIALPGTIGSISGSFFPKGGIIAEQQAHPGGYGSGRLADLVPGLHEAETHLTFGQGFGTRLTDRSQEKVNAPILDDQWLGLLLETGIVGVVALLWLFVALYRRLMRAARSDDTARAWLFAGIAAAMVAFAVSMATYDTFSFIQQTIVAFVYVGIAGSALALRE